MPSLAIYEILDLFENAKTDKARKEILIKNFTPTLAKVLEYAFHPGFRWTVKEMPHNYKIPDTLPGVSLAGLGSELRRLYLFQEGHPTAQSLTPAKKNELLLKLLESIEPREAEVVMGIFRKDLGVKGLDYKFVKSTFPNLIP
jgi:hypothetical protein